MSDEFDEARWPKLLSLAVHEFRTPITVASGYLRMVLKERAGPVTEQQRKLLEEAEKSCGRLSALVAEMSELSALEGGQAGFNRGTVELGALLADVVAGLPALPERDVNVVVEGLDGPVTLAGDPTRLRTALSALVVALRREVISADRLVVNVNSSDGSCVLALATPDAVAELAATDPGSLERFDEWRGGSGLSLAIARRIITQHGGALLAPPGEGKAGALVTLPRR